MTDPTIRGLTLRQPWGWAVAHQGKDVENRTWPTRYRGLVAVHAGKSAEGALMPFPAAIRAHLDAQRDQSPELAVRGAIVAIASLEDVHLAADCMNFRSGRVNYCSPWAQQDQYHWRLTRVKPLTEPVPCRGSLGLWKLPADVDATVLGQLRQVARADKAKSVDEMGTACPACRGRMSICSCVIACGAAICTGSEL